MSFENEVNYYEVLDLPPDASSREIDEAYRRLKSAYTKDNIALYSLISVEEREQTLQRIDEAYSVLSNTHRRKEYDRSHGRLSSSDPLPPTGATQENVFPGDSNVVSIDRVPPMSSLSSAEDLLIPPSTDFQDPPPPPSSSTPPAPSKAPLFSAISNSNHYSPPPVFSRTPLPGMRPIATPSAKPAETSSGLKSSFNELPPPTPVTSKAPLKPTPNNQPLDPKLVEEISQEIEWKGILLKSIRESQKISIEELASTTKISKTYLIAIEEENYSKLPAAVFLRGFLVQLAKVLKLQPEKVAAAYLARYYRARPEQNS